MALVFEGPREEQVILDGAEYVLREPSAELGAKYRGERQKCISRDPETRKPVSVDEVALEETELFLVGNTLFPSGSETPVGLEFVKSKTFPDGAGQALFKVLVNWGNSATVKNSAGDTPTKSE
jgi:hypothetical protein